MSRAADRITSVDDALHYARKRLPPSIMQTFENGAGALKTHDANLRALDDVQFRPRHGIYHARRDISTTVLGHQVRTPLISSSIGALGLAHPCGEAGVARATGAAGGITFVSGFTSQPIEEIVAAASGPVYFQLYYFGTGREGMAASIERARDAGCDGLVFVIDSVAGHTPPRSLAVGNRRFLPGEASLHDMIRFAPQFLTRPGWALDYLRGRVPDRAPMALAADGSELPFAQARAHAYDQWPEWSDIDWIRDVWDCPIVVKGALSVDDARHAVEAGAVGVVVSNHGGNRLDGTIPALPVLPQVVEAVGDQIDVLYDSGIRTGPDAVKAIALGAKAVGLGRAYLYPLIAAGEPGVRRIYEIFARDIANTLAYLGCQTLDELEPGHLELPPSHRAASGATG